MENNVNFNADLTVSYLAQLVDLESRQEFDKFYSSVEDYLVFLVKKSNDLELLNKVNKIFAFRKKCMSIQL